MTSEKKIALLTCYIGKLPWYFDFFVYSCSFNASVDFFIYTDDRDWQGVVPENVKIRYTSLAEISDMASQKLGFEAAIPNGYKLCDFKPAYGYIFSNVFKEYDFWGHCDIDIIFGDIREFITDDLLENYDLISVRHDYISGCFLLYRNTYKMNTLFMQSKDYHKVFTAAEHYCFDETNFTHEAFGEGTTYDEIPAEIESMMHVVKRLEADSYIKPFFDFFVIEGLQGKLRWENGKLYYRSRYEVLFYHMIYFKRAGKPRRFPRTPPSAFSISRTRIY